jgi:hypothetical protein
MKNNAHTQTQLPKATWIKLRCATGKQRRSRNTENFASIRAPRLLTGLEVTHVDGLPVRIKGALHKTRLVGNARSKGDLSRNWRGRRCDSRRRGGAPRRCDSHWRRRSRGPAGRRWSHGITGHRCIGIGRLNSGRRVRINWFGSLQITILFRRHTVTRRDIQRTAKLARRRSRTVACAQASDVGDQQKGRQGKFHGGCVGRIRRLHAWA